MIGMLAALLTATLDLPSPPRAEVDRPVADIVSPIWSDPVHRDAAHEVDQIAVRLHLRAGKRVADMGGGSGYDTLRLAKLVGPTGRVFAEDVTPAYLQQLMRAVRAARLGNVEVVQGEPGDPKLPSRSIDAAAAQPPFQRGVPAEQLRTPAAAARRLVDPAASLMRADSGPCSTRTALTCRSEGALRSSRGRVRPGDAWPRRS